MPRWIVLWLPSSAALWAVQSECAACHRGTVESWAKTGMARSFYKVGKEPAGARVGEFEMVERSGRFFQRRGDFEKEIHFVLGSGRNARSYVSRTDQGWLLAMPLSWYSRNGGFWEMAPGFERPDHPHFRRRINYECMFCHNAYPKIPADADATDPKYLDPLPEGIDCARCHGDASRHISKPGVGTIFNPGKALPARQLEVCLQCHLEPTSNPLPYIVRRPGRSIFSYRPEEPLADYALYFDHAPGRGFDDKFEFVSAPYRLRKSACFQKSAGKMTCTTCHNAHGSSVSYREKCLICHVAAHRREADCVSCHMPRRQPEDARHTRVTDHLIQKIPDRGPGPPAKPYRGEVRVYWPERVHPNPENELLMAVAQVRDGSNLREGVSELEALIRKYRPDRGEFYYELGEALVKSGQPKRALAYLDESVRRTPSLTAAWRRLALLRFPALPPMARADDAFLHTVQGEVHRKNGRVAEAIGSFQAAIAADPDLPEAYVNLGAVLAGRGDRSAAIKMFQQALRIDPGNREAAANLRLAKIPP